MSDKKHHLEVPSKGHQEQQQPVKIKLVPQKLRDLCPELYAENSASKSKKLTPVRLKINPADWEDSLPNYKSKSKATKAGEITRKDPIRKTLAGGVIRKNCVRKPLAGGSTQKDSLKQTLAKINSKQGNCNSILSPTIHKPKIKEKPNRAVMVNGRQNKVSSTFIPQVSVVKQEPQLDENLKSELLDIIHNQREQSKHFEKKLENLQQEFQDKMEVLRKEIKNSRENYTQNMIRVLNKK